MQAINDITTPLFNVYRVLQTLNSQKTLVLDQVPRFIEAPNSFMPRNYLSSPEVCQVQFHRSTTYPWSMLLVGANEARYFPPFTPVVPLPIEYDEGEYDRTLVALRTTTGQPQQQPSQPVEKAKPPLAMDYKQQIQPEQLRQVQSLQIPTDIQPKLWSNVTSAQHKQGSLCKPGARIVYQFANTPTEFYESNKNNEPTPYAPTGDVVRQYERYLINSAAGEQQQQQQQQQQPKEERMEIEPEFVLPQMLEQMPFEDQFER